MFWQVQAVTSLSGYFPNLDANDDSDDDGEGEEAEGVGKGQVLMNKINECVWESVGDRERRGGGGGERVDYFLSRILPPVLGQIYSGDLWPLVLQVQNRWKSLVTK